MPVAVSHFSGPRQSSSFVQPVHVPRAVSQCEVAPVQSSSLVHEVAPGLPPLPEAPDSPPPGAAESSEPHATAQESAVPSATAKSRITCGSERSGSIRLTFRARAATRKNLSHVEWSFSLKLGLDGRVRADSEETMQAEAPLRSLFVAAVATVLGSLTAAGCGSTDDPGGGGAAGRAGSSGAAGTSAAGGGSGTSGASGTGGNSGTNGSAGSGGTSGAGAGGTGADAGGRGGSGGAADGGPSSCPGQCECQQGNTCNFDCRSSGSCNQIDCLGATCTADCVNGGCALDCDVGGTCNYKCSGGGCSTDCDADSMCTIDCSAGGCDILCDANSQCTVTCGGSRPCNVQCQSGGSATCTGTGCMLSGC
jgi:hypothetical protein